MDRASTVALLHRLARLYGVQTAYTDASHHRRFASPEALLAVLRALGAPLATLNDLPSALRQRRQDLWRQTVEPVVVAWEGALPALRVRLPAAAEQATLVVHLATQSGMHHTWAWPLSALPTRQRAVVEGVPYVVKTLSLPVSLPWGYHRLTLEGPLGRAEGLVISAPLQAFTPPPTDGPTWGVFLPLYALHTQDGWGAGDYTALRRLAEWVAHLGGSVVATLPLLALFLEDPCHPSPYSPISRLLWNEFYLDITAVPEVQTSSEARALLDTLRREAHTGRSAPLVDYPAQMRAQRRVLEALARSFQTSLTHDTPRARAFRQFLQTHPWVEAYARFRACGERLRTPWRAWPPPLRDGCASPPPDDLPSTFYHQYVQWLAHEQMDALAQQARQRGVRLLLDFPLGVHPDGFDTWWQRGVFVEGVSVGAPPDAFFSHGQNWAFPPMHPQHLRQQGYAYFRASLRHHLRCAGLVRIDHVMGFHRLFWIPAGMEAKEGVYVRYPAAEFYAILALESQWHRVVVVGEDLGTVPPEVRPAMARHGLLRSYVLPFHLTPTPARALARVPSRVVASLNTHDMPPFGAFWAGDDIRLRQALGLLDEVGAAREHRHRRTLKEALVSYLLRKGFLRGDPSDPLAVLEACLTFLAHSPAQFLVVNLEDLWLETQPQNIPGTTTQYPNWLRKARYSLDEFSRLPQVVNILDRVSRARPRPAQTP
ncbi:MAG: 4-alpha-glucanotransferase [Dehalococcoidia bacterium]|nr:4-alpha-glucanotransferase [Dehalococcoidia bacterium]MDW8119783.1 4-alpha-glucanotransferase [Chloroflexota bacterium]